MKMAQLNRDPFQKCQCKTKKGRKIKLFCPFLYWYLNQICLFKKTPLDRIKNKHSFWDFDSDAGMAVSIQGVE